jgi:tetratricopeptide (TPR) repeat protein
LKSHTAGNILKKIIFLLIIPFVSFAQDADSLIEAANDPMMSNPRKSIRLLEKSLEIVENEGKGRKTIAAEAAEKIADNLFVINEFEESIHYYQKAAEIYQENGENDRRYFCIRKIARANLELQNYEGAYEWLSVAKTYFAQMGRDALLAGTYLLEAEIEVARGNYSEAEELLGKSVSINNRLGNFSNLADNYSLLGKIKLMDKQYPEARK